ncbi:MAG: hypothetical protein KF819_00475 [Labilithrix sp.]|nr:hypothetical protein [Labilithrix sp.]
MKLAVFASFALAAACGGTDASVVGPAAEPGPGGSEATDPAGEPITGAKLTLSLKGSTEPVAHADAYAGQTPTRQIVAVRSLWLLRSADDPSPVRVADLGARAVETDLATGARKDIATVALSSVPAGTYTVAKVGAAYVRYSVSARLHANGFPTDGRYDNVQALSNGASIDGTTRAKGWYRFAFAVGPTELGAVEGDGAPLPALAQGGGMTLDASGPEAFYVFPANLVVDGSLQEDMRLTCEVNVHESFRWQDLTQAGYTAKVYDTTPTTFEPVMSFGASAFSLVLTPCNAGGCQAKK